MDFGACMNALIELKNSNDIKNLDPERIADKVQNILDQNNHVVSKRPQKRNEDSYNPETIELKKESMRKLWEFRRDGTDESARSYAQLRNAYHRALRHDEQQSKEKEVANLLQKSYHEGLNALYKRVKPTKSSNTIDAEMFGSHCRRLFQSVPEPKLQKIPDCSPETHPLLDPISEDEVRTAMTKMKSKAKSSSGISPYHHSQTFPPASVFHTHHLQSFSYVLHLPNNFSRVKCLFYT